MLNIFICTHFRCSNILRAYPRVELNPLLRITMMLSLISCSRWLKCNSVHQVVNALHVTYIVLLMLRI